VQPFGSSSDIYWRLFSYVKPYNAMFAVAVLGMALVASTEPAFAALMKPMLDGSFVNKDPQTIRLVPLALVGIFIVRGIGSFLLRYFMEWVGRHVIFDMREQIFSQLIHLPTSFYDATTTGHLTAKLIYDVEQVANAATSAITTIIKDSLTIVGLLAWMLYLNWQLTLFFIVVTPFIGLVIVYISKRFRKISKRIQLSMGDVSQISHQTIEGNQVVKIYAGQDQEIKKFAQANEFNRIQNMKLALTSAVSVPISQLFAALAIAGILYFATQESMLETISVGTFMSIVAASMMLLAPMKRLTQVTSSLQRGIAAAQSIFTLLDREREKNTGTKILANVSGAMQYNSVCFCYPTSKADVLHNVSLKIAAGETVALVGRSGSGKSTIASLIPRLYDVIQGEIMLDNTPINTLELNNLRHHIAIVSQKITLFNDTIGHNIAYGTKFDISEKDIIEAATAANAMEFINEFPDGLNTKVGEKGVLLSGGQRQRVAIARALLKNAPILILDEATSALDSESERHIQIAIERLMKGRTTLVIAHRLSTIENADNIVVIEAGEIVEQGKHKDLLAKNGYYAALHKMQFGADAKTIQ
jgi:subfamily B ATP-binding cassette protein MsbA